MSELTNLSHATLTILAKSVAAAQKANRKATEAGEYPVDSQVIIDVSGTVKVGEDYSQEIVLKADPFTLLTVALSHLNGVTIESIVEEARTADPKLVASIKAQAVAAWGTVKGGTKTGCKGKVTTTKDSGASLGTVGLTVNE